MFRWPVEFTPLSHDAAGRPRPATLEITPRGAVFTLAALTHTGHPAHLAVIDAYVKGQLRQTDATGLGQDSRVVLSSLAAPLLAAHALGVERLTLADLILLPRPVARDADEPAAPAAWNVRGPDSVRFLLRLPSGWVRVRAAERFEPAGCLGTPQPGQGSPWHDVFVQAGGRPPADPITTEVRVPTEAVVVAAEEQRTAALARFARARGVVCASVESPAGLGAALADAIAARTPTELAASWRGQSLHVSLAPDPDGYQTLCLLPLRADPLERPDPPAIFETMRGAAWAAIESLMGRPLAEYRTEPIALRLLADDGRTTTLDVGASIVIVRNQTVFTGWVGSDGRVMLKLFPPGGMTAR